MRAKGEKRTKDIPAKRLAREARRKENAAKREAFWKPYKGKDFGRAKE